MASEEVDVYDYWGRGSGLANWLMDKMDPSWYSEDFFEEMSKNGISKFTDFRHFDSSSFNSTLNEMDWNSNQKKEFYQKFEHDFGTRFPNLFGNNNKNDNGEERKKSKSSKRRSKRGSSKNDDITMGNTENVKSDNSSRRRTRRGGAANGGTSSGTDAGGVGSEAANSSSKPKSSKKSKSSKKVKSVKEDQDSEMKTKSNKKNKKKSKKSSKSNKMDDEKASTKKKKSSNRSKNNNNDNNNNNNNDNIDNNGNEIFEFMEGIDVLCLHTDGKVYEARVLARKKAAMNGRIVEEYLLHFRNWNSRYDAWVSGDNIFDKTPDNLKAMHECNARMTK